MQIQSPMAVSTFSINQLAYNFSESMIRRVQIEFEFISKARNQHLAMALDATYFPFRAENDNKIYTDEAETSMMEGMMKVYWYAPEQVKRMQSIWNTNYMERNMLDSLTQKKILIFCVLQNGRQKYQTPEVPGYFGKSGEDGRNRSKTKDLSIIIFCRGFERTAKSTSIVDFLCQNYRF